MYSVWLGLSSIPGGQTAADAALATLDVAGYAAKRSEVLPRDSPWGTCSLSLYSPQHSHAGRNPPLSVATVATQRTGAEFLSLAKKTGFAQGITVPRESCGS